MPGSHVYLRWNSKIVFCEGDKGEERLVAKRRITRSCFSSTSAIRNTNTLYFFVSVLILKSIMYVMLGKLFAHSNFTIRFPGSHTLCNILPPCAILTITV